MFYVLVVCTVLYCTVSCFLLNPLFPVIHTALIISKKFSRPVLSYLWFATWKCRINSNNCIHIDFNRWSYIDTNVSSYIYYIAFTYVYVWNIYIHWLTPSLIHIKKIIISNTKNVHYIIQFYRNICDVFSGGDRSYTAITHTILTAKLKIRCRWRTIRLGTRIGFLAFFGFSCVSTVPYVFVTFCAFWFVRACVCMLFCQVFLSLFIFSLVHSLPNNLSILVSFFFYTVLFNLFLCTFLLMLKWSTVFDFFFKKTSKLGMSFPAWSRTTLLWPSCKTLSLSLPLARWDWG